MHFVPSVIHGNYRVRAIYNTIHFRPASETFHEFLLAVISMTLGEDWWNAQLKMKSSDKHIAARWAVIYEEFTKNSMAEGKLEPVDGVYKSKSPGPVWALLSLGYDLYCLQVKNSLPDFLIRRLRDHSSFQSARYEVAVAAIMARAGFEITFLDDKVNDSKHCEFIALHTSTSTQVGVEAKSRVRQGAYHERGNSNYVADKGGIEKLLRKAQKQKPDNLPFFIFIDMNVPPSPAIDTKEKQWFTDFKNATDSLKTPLIENPDIFNAIFATNMAHHYGSIQVETSSSEWSYIIPEYSVTPLTDQTPIEAVVHSLDLIDYIPIQI